MELSIWKRADNGTDTNAELESSSEEPNSKFLAWATDSNAQLLSNTY